MNPLENTVKWLLFSISFLLLSSCEKFEYSPYQEKNNVTPEALNASNIQKLIANEGNADDTVTILFTGDSQRFYSSLDALVQKTNSIPNIDFLVLAGDISDFGLLQEFLWVHERLEKLTVPYLCVIGNHDLTANGSKVYSKIWGPKNFSFVYKGYKFLFHDTNGREYNFNGQVPDLAWLRAELSGAEYYVGVSHVPPYDADFDNNLEFTYKNMLSSTSGFILSLHGHLHEGGDSYFYDDNVRYITSYSVVKNKCLLLKLIDGKIIKQEINY
jgi:3',5'-cyclic AMP phosphodiesterase CpdA